MAVLLTVSALIIECDEATREMEEELEVSDVVAWANRIQKDKKRKHIVRPSTSSSGSKKSSTSVSLGDHS